MTSHYKPVAISNGLADEYGYPQGKHIEAVRSLELYDTKIPSLMESNGLQFHWFSWVLCEISMSKGNPVFPVMCSGFRGGFGTIGEIRDLTIDSWWNPSCEDDCRGWQNRGPFRKWLYLWQPVAIIKLEV